MLKTPKRILLVDNDPDVLASVGYNLRSEAYEVLTAASEELARQLLERELFHLAIIDIRLEDEQYKNDLTGFQVAQALPASIPCVIYTAYEDKENIRQALGKVGAKEIVDKTAPDAPARLIKIVNQLFASAVKINFDLEIAGSLDLARIADQIEVPTMVKELKPSATDVQQVLQTLFYSATSVYLTPLLSPESAPTLTQSGSLLLLARPRFKNGWGAPVVVKLSASEEISREAGNYALIRPFLGGHRLAVLEREAYARQIGGLVYTLIGAGDGETIHTFGELFLNEKADTIADLLERFFTQTFGSLFADARRETLNLTATYTQGLRLMPAKLHHALETLHPEALKETRLRFNGLKGVYPNPVLGALHEDKFQPVELVSRQCLCHGDLHGRNILVDGQGHFWLIDFARVRECHALRDFAELETDIKFNLLPVIDLEALLPFERALLEPINFGDLESSQSFANSRLDHAYQVIVALRRIAARLIDLEGDMREYYHALFFHTLNIIRLRHISPAKKEYALLAASLIYQRLEEWPKGKSSAVFPTSSKLALVPTPSDQPLKQAPSVAYPPPSTGEGQGRWWSRLVGAGAFLLVGVGVLAFLWRAMQSFAPGWSEHVITLVYISVFAIVAFTLLDLITGSVAIEALQKIIANLTGGARDDAARK